jgi:ribonuclease Z
MKVTFLGTSSGAPSRFRNVSGLALQLPQQAGVWLFDCGEATQHQIMRSPLRLSQIDRIFISHLHGDHVFGLPGLLASRSLQAGSVTPVTLYGPPGLQEYLRRTMDLTQMRLGYPHEVKTIAPGLVWEDARTQVFCAPVAHRIPAFGYSVVERDLSGRFDVERARALGIPEGPVYGRLKSGETVTLDDGRVIDGRSLTGSIRRGRKFVYAGDTTYSRNTVDLARDADLLIHEATYLQEDLALAERASHSTSVMAANVAREASARALILTHFSTRYEGEGGNRLTELLTEAQAIFPNTHLARDLWTFEIASEDEHKPTSEWAVLAS